MPRDFLPHNDAALLEWMTPFSEKLTATPAAFGIQPAQATQMASYLTDFSDALAISSDPATRTRSAVEATRNARTPMKAYARELARIINAFPAITNVERLDLGLNPRKDEASPINPPTEAPVLEVVKAIGRLLRCKVHGQDSTKRGKPDGCASATIFSYVGNSPPADVSLYKFEGTTTRTSFEIAFPATVPAGAQVWLCAFWSSPRSQSGPACQPITAYLAGGVVSTQAA